MATMDSILSGIDGGNEEKTLEALSQAAEAAERYEDMVKIMEKLVKNKLDKTEELSPDQRNLLSVAYKNVVGAKRSSWRMLNDDNQFDEATDDFAAKYKKCVENELEENCTQILDVLQKLSSQNAERMKDEEDAEKKKQVEECQVFYLKMIGDYYRYLTEAFPYDKYKDACNKNYDDAMKIAEESLDATHPSRLGLALNYSVYHYEILNQPKEACTLAKKAFDEAIEKLTV